jgi:putative selenate reductase
VLGEPGPDGRRRPAPIPGSAFQIEASAVIVATGQRPDVAFLDGSGLALRPNGAIAVDPDTGRTGAAGVYAGGDATRGPAIIVEACADGRRAAEAICAQLGLPFCAPPVPRPAWTEAELLELKRARARLEMPCQPPTMPPAQRGGFDLVEGTLSAEDARHEAARCLQCATLCDKCVEVCPNRANVVYRAAPLCWQLPLLSCRGSELAVAGYEPFAVTQERQILHLHDLCNECGNCATFCVHPGRPYADKPRLFLRLEEWARERDNAWLVAGNVLRRREGGSESRLERLEEGWRYEDARVRVRLSPAFEVVEMALREPFAGTLSLRPAAEMAVVLRGIQESLPFLVELQ